MRTTIIDRLLCCPDIKKHHDYGNSNEKIAGKYNVSMSIILVDIGLELNY